MSASRQPRFFCDLAVGSPLRSAARKPQRASRKSAVSIAKSTRAEGFSLIEVMLVAAISVTLAAVAIPNLIRAARQAKLRGAAADFSTMLQTARTYAVRDNRFYSLYILAGSGSTPQRAYVDMLPKSLTGASGNGGTAVASGDPVVEMASEVLPRASSSAPNTANLSSQLLPSTTTVTPTDASSSSSPATFGPRGLPCQPLNVVVAGVTAGTVCDSSGGPVAYWIFFQHRVTSEWVAVTVTPAGRIQKWYYNGSAWTRF